jgi:hypothetical protein
MIAIQVAAGIVLAYILIVNQRPILRVIGWCMSALLAAGIMVAIGWGGSAAVGAVGSHWPVIWFKIGIGLGALAFLAVFATGGYALIRILRVALKTGRPDLSGEGGAPALIVGGFALVNFFIAYAVSWPVLTYTVIGTWYDAVDAWSRQHGSADAVSVLAGGIACLWSVPVAMFLRKGLRAQAVLPVVIDSVPIERSIAPLPAPVLQLPKPDR